MEGPHSFMHPRVLWLSLIGETRERLVVERAM